MSKHNLKLLIITALLICSTFTQAGILLSPDDCNDGNNCWITNDNSNFHADDVAALIGYNGELIELYKQNVDDAFDTGSFAESYVTTFSNDPTDPSDALIQFVLNLSLPSINCPDCFVLIKGGNQTPAQYIYSLGDTDFFQAWDGLVDIFLTGFWPDVGAISHIAIYGNVDEGNTNQPSVPEPSVFVLLLVGLLGYKITRKIKIS